MNELEKLEYQNLAEDRRQAISFFLKGFIIAVGIIAFAFKVLTDYQNKVFVAVAGGLGLGILATGFVAWCYCKRHVCRITDRLDELGKPHGAAPVVPTEYIFVAALAVSALIGITWLGVLIYMLSR